VVERSRASAHDNQEQRRADYWYEIEREEKDVFQRQPDREGGIVCGLGRLAEFGERRLAVVVDVATGRDELCVAFFNEYLSQKVHQSPAE
jgi:hypothetical protein